MKEKTEIKKMESGSEIELKTPKGKRK